jgi:hypothetical protein
MRKKNKPVRKNKKKTVERKEAEIFIAFCSNRKIRSCFTPPLVLQPKTQNGG